MGRDIRQGRAMPNVAAEEGLRQAIQNSNGFKSTLVKQLFPNVQESDIDEVMKKLNEKFNELKKKMLIFNPNTLTRFTPDEFNTEIGAHIAEMTIQYDNTGLEKIYKKITKVLTEIPSTDEYKEDLAIVREIKKEYIETKKMPKSTMLYLNKIHRQLTQDKENGEIKTESGDEKSQRRRFGGIKSDEERFRERLEAAVQNSKWNIN